MRPGPEALPRKPRSAPANAGFQTAAGFADPEYGLVETWAFIGMPGESKHRDRNP